MVIGREYSRFEIGGVIIGSIIIGMYIQGMFNIISKKEDEKQKQEKQIPKPGIYVNHVRTNLGLIAIGMHALKDGLYDTYELHEILKEVKP